MVSDLKTFAYKGVKIAVQKKIVFGEFCLTSRIFLVSVSSFVCYLSPFSCQKIMFFYMVELFGGRSVINGAYPV